MEPDRQDRQKALEPSAAQKPRRFRIVKLEDRIAPGKGGATGNQVTCHKCNISLCCYSTGGDRTCGTYW